MIERQTNLDTLPKELAILHEYFGGLISEENDVFTITLSPTVGSGYIRHTNLQAGLNVIDFDCKLNDDAAICAGFSNFNTLQFIYCLHGNCFHGFALHGHEVQIEPFQTAVVSCDTENSSRLKIEKGINCELSIILADKNVYLSSLSEKENPISRKLKKQLFELNKVKKFFHLGNYNLRIAEQLKHIKCKEHENTISHQLSKKGRYFIVLAKHIEQFLNEIGTNKNTSGLLRKELKRITEASEFVQKSPEIQHTIKSLCSFSGLSPAKLQDGFKFMFERTVSDYIRNVRLEKAEELLRTTDLSISEVVYTIGLTSRSYFCKIFKRKYDCRPKDYKYKNH